MEETPQSVYWLKERFKTREEGIMTTAGKEDKDC